MGTYATVPSANSSNECRYSRGFWRAVTLFSTAISFIRFGQRKVKSKREKNGRAGTRTRIRADVRG